MAFRTQKISQMTPKGANLEATDLIEVSTIESGSYVTRSITGQEIIDAAVGNVDWGDIGGTLSAQTDLQSALDAKVPTTRTLTINGVTQDLSADRTFTISTPTPTLAQVTTAGNSTTNGITIGNVISNGTIRVTATTASPSGNASFFVFDGAEGTNFAYDYGTATYRALAYNGSLVRFLTAGTERARFAITTGNVLIGTTTDAGFRLDVNGTARTQQLHTFSQGTYLDANTSNNYHRVYTGASTYGGLQLQNEIVNYTGYITTGRSGNQSGINFFHTTYAGGVSASSHQKFTQGGVQFGSLSLPNTLTVFNVGGGNGTVNYPIVANNQLNTTNTGVGYLFQTGDSTGSGPINHAAISAWKTNGAAPSVTSSLRFYTINDAANSLTEKMRIADSGNILINTTTDAGFRLDVNGTARIVTSLVVGGTGSGSLTTSVVRCNYLNTSDNGYSVMQLQTLTGNATFFQGVSIGSGVNPVASAQLEVASTTKGFLPPRMTTTQKNAIASPVAGLMVYDTTLNVISYYNGSMWI